ncbi:MAG: glycosyltransferase WbuB [Chloroflexi bacterium HGW-Chloroflexi-6]|nr:MAG: glycosyltransferase WbuB [Chloroflexi bacterium HGW-Chloroflexi-6]
MRILFCRSNPIAPDPRVEKEAAALTAAGYQVQAIAWDRSGSLPLADKKAGFQIHRLPIRAAFGHGMGNFPALIKWQFGLLNWLISQRKTYDVIHACDFDTILPALVCKLLFRKSVVYDIFDFYADHLRATPGWIKTLIRKFDLFIIGQVDAAILVDEARGQQINGSHPKQLIFIYNSPEETLPALANTERKFPFRIVYVGLLQVERGLLELLDILEKHPDWHLDLAGFGGDEDQIQARAALLPNVLWHGRIAYDETLRLSQQADALIATYDPSIPNHRYSSPNKVFEAMLLSKPIVVAQDTNMDCIIEDNKCGLVVPYADVDALEQAFLHLFTEPGLCLALGQNGRNAYEKKYGWPIMKTRLLNLYQSLA